MRVTRWGEYGILCCLYMARRQLQEDSIVNAADIEKSEGIPLDFVRQILQRLKKGGIVDTVRGPHGGYKLNRALNEVSLKDILYATEGDVFQVVCDSNPVSEDCGSQERCCVLKPIWYGLHEQIESYLKGYTLERLLEMPEDQNLQEFVQLTCSDSSV